MTDRQGAAGRTQQPADGSQWRADGKADDARTSSAKAEAASNPPAGANGSTRPVIGHRKPSESASKLPSAPAKPIPAAASAKPAAETTAVDEEPKPLRFPRPPAKAPVVAAKTTNVPETPAKTAAVTTAPAATPVVPATGASHGARRTRKARLRLAKVDPWSVMKTSFLFSIAFGIMFWTATWLLWQVILGSGLFDAINTGVASIVSSSDNTEGFRIEDYISTNKVLGIAALLAVVNVVITTALGTIGAFLYNLSANILGGLELTLAED